MKTNGCHYEHFTSYCTGSITKPDKEFSSWPTRYRRETLHLCFYFFILRDCDAVTYGSTVPKGKMCQIRYYIAQWVQHYSNTARVIKLFPTGPTNAKNECGLVTRGS